MKSRIFKKRTFISVKKTIDKLKSIIGITLFITACGKDKFEEVTYKKGLPEDSTAFKEFMRHEL
ncbi:hypothetical protein [Bacillus changyiensis]|uniref:hypothetical protein n=1 Tax=Bacillus changyiensis TaxID=3004103 RepID=UPI0022E17265|nr:hypothetical protein [Bacillus changyiensis]MDA1476873.1 hypothetical protein [Bacillus changyiensis]